MPRSDSLEKLFARIRSEFARGKTPRQTLDVIREMHDRHKAARNDDGAADQPSIKLKDGNNPHRK